MNQHGSRVKMLASLMLLVRSCHSLTQAGHVLLQTPQRSGYVLQTRPGQSHPSTRPRHAVVRAAAAGEMGFQLQAAPLLSTALVFLSWGWLQWKSSQYNSIGDELDVELETLQKLTVETLTSGDAAAVERREAAQRAVDATRARMEEARTIRGPGGLVARIRLPQRGAAKSFENCCWERPKGACAPAQHGIGAQRRSVATYCMGGIEGR